MKKFLSLVLALVMTMSLVTISAGAKDFTDDESITYEEAVTVMSEVKVLDGYTDGSFKPQGELTRGAAAKIICNLILGPTTAAELHADTAPFKDVPVDHTFAGYIAYCAKEGIISGYTDGTFRPAAPLTGYAFMKMLLGALGYDSGVEGYTGANWSINVAKRALSIGLNKGLEGEFSGIKAVNREEAALYAFNTLKADLVEYDSKTSVTVGGAEVVIAGSEAKAQRWNNSATKIENIKKDNYIQFAEQYFTKLALDATVDAFGRPCSKWTLKNEEIGTFINRDLLVATYTQEVTGKDLYDLLGRTAIEDYELAVYIDGIDDATVDANVFGASKMAKTYKLGVGATGDGVLTEVYVDSDAKEITIAIINTYLAKTGDYNSKKDTLSLTIYGVDEVDAQGNLVKKTGDSDAITAGKQPYTEGRVLDGEDFDIEGYKDGDIVLVNVAAGAVEVIADPETVDDVEINAFKKGSYVSVSGDQYDYADTALYDPEVLDQYDDNNMKNATYKLFLDPYGYMIGIKLVTADDTYVFITGYDRPTSNLYNKTADAAAIFLDGTMKTIKVEADATILSTNNGEPCHNTWYTYTVDKNDVYSLKAISKVGADKISQSHSYANDDNKEINKNQVSLPVYNTKFAYGNDDTVYLTASTKGINATNAGYVVIIDDVDSVTTGVKNVSITTIGADTAADNEGTNYNTLVWGTNDAKMSGGVYTLYNTNTGYVVAAVVVGEDDAVTSNYAYVIGSVNREAYDKAEDEYTWNIDVVIDGEKVTLEEKGSHLSVNGIDSMTTYNWYKVSYKADGTVKKVDLVTPGTTSNTYEYFSIFNGQVTSAKKDAIIVANPVHATTSYKVQLKGYTLHIDPALGWDTGIDVLPECKAVVLEQIDGSVKVEYFDGTSNNVRNAVDFLHANPFEGYVYAVMKDGLASTIIFDTTGTDQQSQMGGQPTGKITNAAITRVPTGELKATWDASDTSYNSGCKADVVFYLKDGEKAYQVDAVDYTGNMGQSGNYLQSVKQITENGDYYAVITISDVATGAVLATATTATVGFTH